jgi:hypothetical protein
LPCTKAEYFSKAIPYGGFIAAFQKENLVLANKVFSLR